MGGGCLQRCPLSGSTARSTPDPPARKNRVAEQLHRNIVIRSLIRSSPKHLRAPVCAASNAGCWRTGAGLTSPPGRSSWDPSPVGWQGSGWVPLALAAAPPPPTAAGKPEGQMHPSQRSGGLELPGWSQMFGGGVVLRAPGREEAAKGSWGASREFTALPSELGASAGIGMS